jgi:mono/diheme cytochrome c family protein
MMGGDPGGMMGGGNGMMERHHAQVPAEYAGMTAPVVTEESVLRGFEIYTANCASCHGETGLGDGPVSVSLDPKPAPISHTTQMLADDLLFYRVSEGGIPFQTAMPAWKGVLDEQQIWDVVAYIRELGAGNATQIDEMRAAQQETMLTKALSDGAITEEQADVFRTVHTALEDYMGTNSMQGNMTERENEALTTLIESGEVTQEQVNEFQVVHAILASGGYMP